MKPAWLLVSGDFVPFGGMDCANHALARYLANKANIPVHLVTHRVADDLQGMPGMTIHPVWRPFHKHLIGMPLLSWSGQRWARRLANRGGRILVNGGNCPWGDINWVHYVHAAYQPHARGSAAYRLKTRLTHRYALAGEQAALAKAQVVICNSERTRRDVTERVGVRESRTHVVYYGSDPDRFSPVKPAERLAARQKLGWRNDRPLVVFIGALGDRRKGFDTLFAAWQIVCQDPSWDCTLVVIGAGAELPAWRNRAEAAELSERVWFLGFRRDVPTILAASNLLVHPARYEAYGLGVHEALCRGIPAMVSAEAGVAERFPAELNHLLIPDPDDSVDLADRLTQWRKNLDDGGAAVTSLSATLRMHTWDKMAEQITCLAESN
jgi:glycosyltransferase involved in cell wall biosynthesis